LPDTSGFVFKATGSDVFFGKLLPYEAYGSSSDPDAETRLFADGANLAGMQVLKNGKVVMETEFIKFSKNIPSGMFDIPEDYDILEQE